MAERNSFLQGYQLHTAQNAASLRSSKYSDLNYNSAAAAIASSKEVTPTNKNSSKFILKIILYAFAALIASLGTGFGLLLYLLHGKVDWTADELVTTVPQGNVLLMTTVISKVVLTLVPLAVGISAYWIGGRWLSATKSTTRNGTRESLPTPYQYSLLLKIFQGASPFSLWTTIRYLTKSTSNTRVSASRQLIQAIVILFAALVLAYGLVGADFALHSLSTTRLVSISGEPLGSASNANLHGRRLKDECGHATVNGSACTVEPFGRYTSRQSVDYKEGYRILGGFSSSSQISLSSSTASNGYAHPVALLTDANPPNNVTFTASTIGLSTKCSVLTSTCDVTRPCDENFHPPTIHRGYTNGTGWSGCGSIACTADGWPRYWISRFRNETSMSISEPLEFRAEPEIVESQISPEDPSTGHNPFRVMLLSSTYVDSKILADDCVEQSPSGMCIRGKDTGYLYSGPTHVFPSPHYRLSLLGCEVTVVEIEYSYLNGSYTADYSTARMADNATTWAINNVLYVSNARTKFIENALYAFASSGGASSALATLVEEKLARMLLSMSHSAFETTPILRLSGAQQVLATVLPTSALTVFFAFLLGFAAFVVVVAALSATSPTTAFYVSSHQAPHHGHGHSHGQGGKPELVSEVEVAARQILEPTGLIYKIFEEGTDHQCRWAKDGIKMFVEGQALSHQHQHYAATGGVRDVKIGLGPNGAFGFQ